MSLIRAKYRALAPRLEYLQDEVVLSLAWKKASAYVRRHNWYADTLELDASGLNLQGWVETLATEFGFDFYEPAPARLVPAPKNRRWSFDEDLQGGWGPVPETEPVESDAELPADAQHGGMTLRPLAHLGIREQTAATAVLLCLADCIETAQGNPAIKSVDALESGLFSYGNRLFCRWSGDNGQARFSWGSADTYSRYSADYQQFVSRPRDVAAALDSTTKRQVYVVKLDISAYYDCIQIPRLVAKLRDEYAKYRKADASRPKDDDGFWELAEKVLTIGWSDKDKHLAHLLKEGRLPSGLPQGLMASGFFANAYLLDFDRSVGRHCKLKTRIKVGKTNVVLHDYCRYVDDLRLVVSCPDHITDVEALKKRITAWVQAEIDRSLGDDEGSTLSLNQTKTELELLSHVAKAPGIAGRMKQVQQSLSGPFDLSTLEEVETALEGMLSMAEAEPSVRSRGKGKVPSLAMVTKPPMDVRDDTLTRFAAFRLCKSLKQRRLLTDLLERGEHGTAGEELIQDYEMVARRLVGAWAENPALVQVLRYALDLYPSPHLLSDVLDALNRKLSAEAGHEAERSVAWYILAELYRAGATETGKMAFDDDGFEAGDLPTYREDLSLHAQSVLEAGGAPWYVQQQAALLLSSNGEKHQALSDEPELARYRVLRANLDGEFVDEGLDEDDIISTAIVGYQLVLRPRAFALWFSKFAQGKAQHKVKRALALVFRTSPPLFKVLAKPNFGHHELDPTSLSAEQVLYLRAQEARRRQLPKNEWVPLGHVICNDANPFRHENALLQLALSLLRLRGWHRRSARMLSVHGIEVRCQDWAALDDPSNGELQTRRAPTEGARAATLSHAPAWCEPNLSWQYSLGTILRAAAVGSLDFTVNWRRPSADAHWYRGLPSTPSRRQLGMLHSSQALGGTTSSVTPWFSGLLGALLRWPGIEGGREPHEAEGARTVLDMREVLSTRLKMQGELYGASSKSPVYRYPVSWEAREDRTLRVVVVQGLLPTAKEFKELKLEGLDSLPFRTRHRNHTAALLNLVSKKLEAYEHLSGPSEKPTVDLVVLPEYSVHVLDQDLLRAFSDRTGAMLHYGLLSARHPVSNNYTNASRWLIPVRTKSRRSWIEVDQGKSHLTTDEVGMGVDRWCPYRVVIELQLDAETNYRMVGAICYDATDLALASDMKNESHMFVVPAYNKDTKTFDSMIAALRYHMYQHVVICNTGEFGGSSTQAPYDEEHRRTISHAHGASQLAIAVFTVNVDDFGPRLLALDAGETTTQTKRLGKTPPAGLSRRR